MLFFATESGDANQACPARKQITCQTLKKNPNTEFQHAFNVLTCRGFKNKAGEA
jgi:hypothetical protein